MSAGEAGGSGSRVAVTQRPKDCRLRVLGLRSKLIGMGGHVVPGPMFLTILTDAQDRPHIFPVDFFTATSHPQPGPIELFDVQPCP